jgi:hypothetical protein
LSPVVLSTKKGLSPGSCSKSGWASEGTSELAGADRSAQGTGQEAQVNEERQLGPGKDKVLGSAVTTWPGTCGRRLPSGTSRGHSQERMMLGQGGRDTQGFFFLCQSWEQQPKKGVTLPEPQVQGVMGSTAPPPALQFHSQQDSLFGGRGVW